MPESNLGRDWREVGRPREDARERSFDGLAASVVRQLAGAGRQGEGDARSRPLRRLVGMVLSRGEYDPDRTLACLRSDRVTDVAIFTVYVPQAARLLGDMWLEDGLSFAEVSVGAARLQSLVRRVEDERRRRTERRSAEASPLRLMIVVPGDDQHTLGAVTLSVLRRHADDEVALRFNPRADDLARDLTRFGHDAVILSCSTGESLRAASHLLARLRADVPHPPVLALGGPAIAHLDGTDAAGADVVTDEFAVVEKLARARRSGRIAQVE